MEHGEIAGLVATGKPVGLLLNFAEGRVEVKRKMRNLNPQ
jgi:hypothetical protein